MNIYKNKKGIFISDKINNLKYQLNKDSIDMKKVKDTIKELDEAYTKEDCDYIESLLNPKEFKGAKLPSKYATPSTTFQLHNFFSFRINTSVRNGNDVFVFNPFYLYSDDIRGTKAIEVRPDSSKFSGFITGVTGQYWYMANSNMDGMHQINNNWATATTVTAYAPEVYSKYRVVSACMELRYLGPIDEACGVIGAGINFEKFQYLSGTYYDTRGEDAEFDPTRAAAASTLNPQLPKYTNFDLIRDSSYFKENNCLEGMRLLYFPIDNKSLEYKPIITKKDISVDFMNSSMAIHIKDPSIVQGFNWFVYLQNCPMSSSRSYRIDYWVNFECIPKPKFLDYIPLTLSVFNVPADLFKKVQEEMEKKAVQKLDNI